MFTRNWESGSYFSSKKASDWTFVIFWGGVLAAHRENKNIQPTALRCERENLRRFMLDIRAHK